MSLAERIILFCWSYIFPLVVLVYLLIVLYEFLLHERRKKKRERHLLKEPEEDLNESKNVGEIEWNESDAIPETKKISYVGATSALDNDPLKAASKFYQIVRDRRSVSKFSSKPVDLAIVERCIQAAGTSPSPGAEPWMFCAVSDKRIKEQIREILESGVRDSNEAKEYLTTAPHLVLIFVKTNYGVKADYNEISSSIATGILISALQAAGLNSLVTTPLNCGPALRKLLNRPINEKLLFLLPVGYAAVDCKVPVLNRKPVEEFLVKY